MADTGMKNQRRDATGAQRGGRWAEGSPPRMEDRDGGVLAGATFKQIWKLAAGEDDAPKATDARRGWGEVLPAAALQGAVYAGVNRGAAEGTHKLTGVWPGANGEQSKKAA
jgi:Protein of unknown function (DUF4235)